MNKLTGWDKVRLYGGAITGGASSFVTGACIGFVGRYLTKNPIINVIWYIGGASIGMLVGKKVEDEFVSLVTDTEGVVGEIQKVVDEELNASEVV